MKIIQVWSWSIFTNITLYLSYNIFENVSIIMVENVSFFTKISSKFRVSGIDDTKEGGKMSMKETSKNFTKNRLEQKNRRFLKKIAAYCKKSMIFRFVSSIFLQFFEKIGASTCCWSDDSQLPHVNLTIQIWSKFQQSISCASNGPNWS